MPLESSLHAALAGIHRRFIARCYCRGCPAAALQCRVLHYGRRVLPELSSRRSAVRTQCRSGSSRRMSLGWWSGIPRSISSMALNTDPAILSPSR
jgi:hypothetical protein